MKSQRGAALIVAMLIVALAVIATSNFVFQAHVHWRKLENATNTDQARWLLRAAEQWGATVLLDDALQNSVDHLGETWAREMPPVVAEGYHMSGRILEQNGLFNLNNLVLDGKVALAPFVEQRPLDSINEVFPAVHHREIKRRVVLTPA